MRFFLFSFMQIVALEADEVVDPPPASPGEAPPRQALHASLTTALVHCFPRRPSTHYLNVAYYRTHPHMFANFQPQKLPPPGP